MVHHRVTEARCQWSYLVSRSHAEGISKAAMSQVVGTADATSDERAYATRVLPKGVLRELLHLNLRGAAGIVTCLAVTTWWYVAWPARPRLGHRGAGLELEGADTGVRVLLLAQFYPPVIGGEERHVRNLAVELAARGHEVHVACLDVGRPPVVDPGVTVHALPNVGAKVPALYPTADRPLSLPVPDPLVSRALSRLVAVGAAGRGARTQLDHQLLPAAGRGPPAAAQSTRCTTTATSARPSG